MRTTKVLDRTLGLFIRSHDRGPRPQLITEAYELQRKNADPKYHLRTQFDKEFIKIIRDGRDPKNCWDEHKFNWNQNVRTNLRNNLLGLEKEELSRIVRMALPLSATYPKYKKEKVLHEGLPKTGLNEYHVLINDIVEVQYLALVILANHIATIEQLAIAPLSTATADYRRHKEVQEASTMLDTDESKHGRVVERYLVEKLLDELVPDKTHIKGFEGYLKTIRFEGCINKLTSAIPTTSILLALMVEIVGNVFFKLMGDKCPEPLLRDICSHISNFDEQRHIETCGYLYQLVDDKEKSTKLGKKTQELRDKVVVWFIVNKIYSEHTKPHAPIMMALRALGISNKEFIQRVTKEVDISLRKYNVIFDPETVDAEAILKNFN